MTDIANDRRFGSTIQCGCGRVHTLPPNEVIYGDDAFERLPEVCRRAAAGLHATVVMDSRTREAAGLRAVEALNSSGWAVRQVLGGDPRAGGRADAGGMAPAHREQGQRASAAQGRRQQRGAVESRCRRWGASAMTTMNSVTKSLWERYRCQGDLEARQQLLDQYLGLVFHIAGQMLPGLACDVRRVDLVRCGSPGLGWALAAF